MSLFRKIEISVLIGVLITVCISVAAFVKTSDKIRDEVLRLHVIANSDSSVDQNLKLRIRDKILEAGKEIFDGSVDVNSAIDKITPQINKIESAAEKEIKDSGFDYNVKVTIDKEYFTTRTYESVTLPAGDYMALRVIIGEGKGHNWWCVMFPPMCLPAADKNKEISNILSDDEIKLVEKKPKYEPRFKIVEIIESIRNRVT